VHKIIYIWLFLSFSAICFGQQKETSLLVVDSTQITVKHFDLKQLQKYKGSSEFNYDVVKSKPNFLIRIYNWLGRLVKIFLASLFGEREAIGIILYIFKLLPYAVLAATLFILTKLFIKLNRNNLTHGSIAQKGTVKVLDDETIIQTKDLDSWLDKAIVEGNYRLAIRFEYLKILQQLSFYKLIDWEVQKTNLDYYNELTNNQLKPIFKESTQLYDRVWYGNFSVDRSHYSSLKAVLDKFLNTLNQLESKK
jgi:Domain of unknown function (DUF4129)